MSVLKNKRGLSDLEFYRNGIVLRKNLTELLLRDFGIRSKIRKSTAITKHMTEEDAITFQNLVDKYECTNIIDEYPDWLIDKMRNNILNLCYLMIMNITAANSIYPTNESEYYDRRNYQNHAIGNCEQLLHEINKICDEYGIFINHKKTQIVKLTKTFTFLKTRYNLTDTGKVIKRINKDSVTRERRKLKKFRKMLNEGKITYPEIEEAYRSWRGNLRYYSAYNVMKNMDKLFNKLFIKPFIEGSDFYG